MEKTMMKTSATSASQSTESSDAFLSRLLRRLPKAVDLVLEPFQLNPSLPMALAASSAQA